MAAAIDGYVPIGVDPAAWAMVAGPTRAWVVAVGPPGPSRAVQLLYAAGRLALWCRAQHIPLEPAVVFKASTVERFVAIGLDGMAPSSRATIRARLRALAEAAAPATTTPRAPALPRTRVRAPYRPDEVAGLLALARAQPSPTRRQGLLAVILCGVGAGCDARDLRRLRGHDIEATPGGGATVRIRAPRGRSAPVLDAYAAELLEVAGLVGDGLLAGGRREDRRSVTTHLLTGVVGGADLPGIDPGRLRSTWLVTHLGAGTRLDVLMAAAGLSTATSLADLAVYLDPLDAETTDRLLRRTGGGR